MPSPAARKGGTQSKQAKRSAITRFAVLVGGACLLSLIAALVLSGAVTPRVVPGLPDAGALTRWGLPLAKGAMNIAAALTLGLLMLAVLLLPVHKGMLSDEGQGYVRAASWSALVWAATAAVTLVFQLSDVLGLAPLQIVGDQLTSYAGSVGQGIALMLVLLAATAIALISRTTGSAAGALGLVGLALVALLPPALSGHSASSPNHELAITGLALHVLAISVWVGGLIAVTCHALRGGEHVGTAVARFSRMALWAYIAVGVGGVASALSRLYSVGDLFTTSYGILILAKSSLFLVLGYFGWLHRSRVVAKIDGGGRGLFVRMASVEAAIMAVALGLSVALARTAPPPPLEGTFDPVRELLGFPMPPPPTPYTLLTLWRPDLFFGLLVVVLGGLYIAGVVRLRRRGDRWPIGRTVMWMLGLLTIAVMMLTGIGTYAVVLFSVHMTQHMVLSMMTPILLVLGGPMTLALRALHPAKRRGDRGPREWLVAMLNSRFTSVVTHPLFAAPLFVVSTYGLYFSPLFGALMLNHIGHIVMMVHFLIAGSLYYWMIIGVDPQPRKIPHLLRLLLLLLTMGFHAFFGIAIMSLSAPIAMEWYGAFDVPWLGSVLENQHTGGGIAWTIGEIPTLMVVVTMVFQWSRDDARQERRRERHSHRDGSDDADLDEYNAMLASLDRGAKGER